MADSGQTEGLKLIGEWCKWLVAVQSSAIGLVATLVKADGRLSFTYLAATKWLLAGSIVCFVFSIVVAGSVFGSIPVAIADMEEGEKVMDRPVIVFNQRVGPFWAYIPSLFVLFLVGVLLFSVSLLAVIVSS